MFSWVYNLATTTSNSSKFRRKKYVQKKWIIRPPTFQNYVKKSRNTVDISMKEITSKKVRGNNAHFSTIEITSKKVRGNNVDFSTIEISLKKVRGNEITSKKYLEMTWKFVEIWSSTYPRNIHVKSTSIWCGVPVGNLEVSLKVAVENVKYIFNIDILVN